MSVRVAKSAGFCFGVSRAVELVEQAAQSGKKVATLGPIIHITGLRPVSVVGFEGADKVRKARMGSKSGSFGIEMVTLENGGIVKSIHGGLYENSIWYSVYGSKGRMECAREDADAGHIARIYVRADENSGDYQEKFENYEPTRAQDEQSKSFGHGNSDFYTMYNFAEKILGNLSDILGR